VRWFRAAEDGVFRLASEVEYRLKITPRATKLVPTTFDRRMVRLLLIIVPMLISTLFIGDRSLRGRVLFGILVLAALALAFIFVADAFPAKKSSPPPPSPRPRLDHLLVVRSLLAYLNIGVFDAPPPDLSLDGALRCTRWQQRRPLRARPSDHGVRRDTRRQGGT